MNTVHSLTNLRRFSNLALMEKKSEGSKSSGRAGVHTKRKKEPRRRVSIVSISNELKRRGLKADANDTAIARSILELADYLMSQAKAHLKQVIVQHPGFDLHDETHSFQVVKNIEALLGQKGIAARSVFELFLLVASSYLHDCAMAVPEWELNLFRLTEGISSAESRGELGFQNDLKPKISFEDARHLVQNHSKKIFGNFQDASKWIFSAKTENAFLDDLAARLRDYQEFRNGFAEELHDLAANSDKFRERSEQLRQDFIRQTHWLRIETWVRNLDGLFEERLGGLWGKALAHDLAAICRSHGEGRDFLYKLPDNAVYCGASQSNIRLVALMLRLGDAIHFSPDRAPLVLFRQRMIASPFSRQHWEVKNQGIAYSIVDSSNGERTARYSAYFQSPHLYFLFQEYLDMVDRELALYDEIIGRIALSGQKYLEQSYPNLSLQVDRTAIRYDPGCFQPVPGLRFTLNQKRILELLMGIKLYKSRFACLRELYQNSLDACRCMLAAQGNKTTVGIIEFGIGRGERAEDRYIYCRDNGIGMTKEIVARFLLQIGNSFYRSPDFQRLATSWKNPFTPVSQFGIGILSCFMIGKRLEIVSKPMPAMSNTNETICFMIDGPHEHFYYKSPAVTDVEAIGTHGTLVKIFLTDAEKNAIKDTPHVDFAFLQHVATQIPPDSPFAGEAKLWADHIYQHVASFVAQYPEGLQVQIRLGDGQLVELLQGTMAFDYHALGISRQKLETHETAQLRFRIGNQVESYLSIEEHVITRQITIEHDGVIFSCIINFPKPGFHGSVRALAVVGAISMRDGVLIDGISLERGHLPYTMKLTDCLARVGVLNFTGRHRPNLSVDRMSIVEWPNNLEQLISPITKRLTLELLREVALHSSSHGFDASSRESGLIWEYIFTRFGFLAADLISVIVAQTEVTVPHQELSSITGEAINIKQFADAPSVVIRFSNFHSLEQSTKLLLFAKLATAKGVGVEDSAIKISAGKFSPLENCHDWDHFRERQYIFCGDTWKGTFEEFDIVSNIWPVIPSRLFDKVSDRRGECFQINERTKCIHHFGNSFSAVSDLDPVLIHQRLGIYGIKSNSSWESKPTSKIYRFEEARNNFWMHDIGWEWEKPATERKHYLVTAFIAPRLLAEEEARDLTRYESTEPEYVKGVKTGWSILFLGHKDLNSICIPGVVTRQELVNKVPQDFWSRHKDINFEFLDGKRPY